MSAVSRGRASRRARPHASLQTGPVSPGMPPELRARLAASPMAFFRFVNRGVDARGVRGVPRRGQDPAGGEASWRRARRAVRDDGHRPAASTTSTTLARGPAVIDIVRFRRVAGAGSRSARVDRLACRDHRRVPRRISAGTPGSVLPATRTLRSWCGCAGADGEDRRKRSCRGPIRSCSPSQRTNGQNTHATWREGRGRWCRRPNLRRSRRRS